jgi:hypothetical protein
VPCCGAVKAKVGLFQRIYDCLAGVITIDRALNAAPNLAALVASVDGDTSSPSCGTTLNEPSGNPPNTDLLLWNPHHGSGAGACNRRRSDNDGRGPPFTSAADDATHEGSAS